MDTTTWVQPMGGTNVTLADVQTLMNIQSRQFQQSMTENLNRLQAHLVVTTQDLREDSVNAMHHLQNDFQREADQTAQVQGELMRTHNEELTELSRALRENILPTLRARNVRVNVPATPTQTPAASQLPVSTTPMQAPDAQQRPDAQAIAPATPAQVQPGQQRHPSPTQALVANSTPHQSNLYNSIVTQGQQAPSRNRLSYTGPQKDGDPSCSICIGNHG
jgi:hypothetical protein